VVAMFLSRFFKHILMTRHATRRYFNRDALMHIESAIAQSEKKHSGQIQFIVEAALSTRALMNGQSARARALEIFSFFRIWDTEHNNGVLIYLLLADHKIEIIADRGIVKQVGDDYWEQVCHAMEKSIRLGAFEKGVLDGISMIDQALQRHFPATYSGKNELQDRPILI